MDVRKSMFNTRSDVALIARLYDILLRTNSHYISSHGSLTVTHAHAVLGAVTRLQGCLGWPNPFWGDVSTTLARKEKIKETMRRRRVPRSGAGLRRSK